MPDKKNRTIYITESDYKFIKQHLDFFYYFIPPNNALEIIMKCENMLDRAIIVTKKHIVRDVIMINSQFTVSEVKSGVERDFILTLPSTTKCSQRNLSIFSPLGSAVIGFRVGDVIECEDSECAKKYIIKSIMYEGNCGLK